MIKIRKNQNIEKQQDLIKKGKEVSLKSRESGGLKKSTHRTVRAMRLSIVHNIANIEN